MRNAKVIFLLKEDKINKKGEAPIYARITIAGQRSNISINRKIQVSRWKAVRLRNVRKAEDVELLHYMDSIRSRIKEIERDLLERKIEITSAIIKRAFNGKSSSGKSLVEAFEWHNKNFEALVKSGMGAEGTLERYEQALKHIKNFLQWQYQRSDIPLSELEFSFVTDFDFFLRTQKACKNNSTVKYVTNFRRIIRIAVKNGWMKFDPFVQYEGRLQEVHTEFLIPEEIEKIKQKVFPTERLNIIRDVFLFAIYTGYAYSDVKKLTWDDVRKHIDGHLWIFANRQKTKVKENVLVLHPALELLEKYKSHPLCISKGKLFPIPSNQKVNTYLKEIADVCGISRRLTFHVARHTFATVIMLGNGVSLETTMAAIGHKHLKQTQHYARVLDSQVSQGMNQLNKKLKPQDLPGVVQSSLKSA